jgi:hypothetical protein
VTPAVVYVAGAGRSGSTLLDNLLGTTPGWFSTGELRLLWSGRTMWTHLCGCGEPLRSCPVWTAVLEEARLDVPDMAALQDRLSRARRAGTALTTPGRVDRLRYVAGLEALHRAIGSVTGATVLVDSSKSPSGALLTADTGADLAAVHLVRDPRAVAWSWRRTGERAGEGPLPFEARSAVASAAEWLATNAAVEAARRPRPRVTWVRARYEDLVADPGTVLAAVRRAAGVRTVDGDDSGGLRDVPAELAANHTVAGNPSRFRTGPLSLRPDDEWRRRLPSKDRRIVAAVTAPLRWRYGYRGGGGVG